MLLHNASKDFSGYQQCFCFQNQIKYFLDTVIQKTFFKIIKINNFLGDLTDISAKQEALDIRYVLFTGGVIPAGNHSWPWPVRRTVTYAYVLGRGRTPDVLNFRVTIP